MENQSRLLSYSTLRIRQTFNGITLQQFLKGFFRTVSINLCHMLHNCHKQKATSQTNYTSVRGRKHTGAATRLDGWQNETTERKQITLCQRRHQKHPKGRRWSCLTQLGSPPQLGSSLLLLTAASLWLMSQVNHSLVKTNKLICRS